LQGRRLQPLDFKINTRCLRLVVAHSGLKTQIKSFDFGQLEQTPKRIFEIALNQFLIYKSRILNRVLLSKPLSKWF